MSIEKSKRNKKDETTFFSKPELEQIVDKVRLRNRIKIAQEMIDEYHSLSLWRIFKRHSLRKNIRDIVDENTSILFEVVKRDFTESLKKVGLLDKQIKEIQDKFNDGTESVDK